MTPDQNMKQIMQQLSEGLLSLDKSACWLERQMDISNQSLGRIIYGGNKTGCSLSNAAIVAHYLGYKLELTPHHPPADSLTAGAHDKPDN